MVLCCWSGAGDEVDGAVVAHEMVAIVAYEMVAVVTDEMVAVVAGI